MPENFHFLQPQWLYLLLPLVILIVLLMRQTDGAGDAWAGIIDEKLLTWLRVDRAGSRSRLPLWLLAGGWLVAVIALANPVWEKLPQPVFQTDQARVIVLDLSRSMNSSDLKPSRLERARFKITDILAQQQEGVIGLVVFAGDAFTVSPLTRDVDTISAMLPALQPGIMPVQGSRADLGLEKAAELLQQAGRVRGEILLLADSYTDKRAIQAAEKLRKKGYVTSVLGIGTEQGAPLPTGQGGFYTNKDGDVITTQLDIAAMKKLAKAGGGSYVSLSASDADIRTLMKTRVAGSRSHTAEDTFETTRWKETGPWLVFLLLPLAALAFRRGWLLSISLLAIMLTPNEQAMAFSMTDLWQRQDQQAHKALLAGEAERAAELAKDPLRKGVADYRKGDFESAVTDFSSTDSAQAAYNKGNALAKLGKLQQAIDAYDQALKKQPGMDDAEFNREAVKKLLQQQKQSQQQDKQNKQNNQDSKQQGNSKNNSQQGKKGESGDSNNNDQQGENSDAADGEKGSQQSENRGDKGNDKEGSGTDKETDNAYADAAEKAKKATEEDQKQESAEGGQQDRKAQQQAQQQSADGQKGEENGQQGEQQSQARAAGQPQEDNTGQQSGQGAEVEAEKLSSEEQIAAEQWLRRIPDDPAGLLRRKLRYQYIQRGGDSGNPADPQPW